MWVLLQHRPLCQASPASLFQSSPTAEMNRVGKHCGTPKNVLRTLQLQKTELRLYF